MAAGVASRALRSRIINLEGMAGEGGSEAANQQPMQGAVAGNQPTGASIKLGDGAGPSSYPGGLNQGRSEQANQPVSVERARLREQARRGKLPVRKTSKQLVNDLQSATSEASQVVHQLWPNLLGDSDIFRFDVAPDTEDPNDSQMPGIRDEDLDQLAERVKHMREPLKHVQSCLEAVVVRGWGGQAGKEFDILSDSDETRESEGEENGESEGEETGESEEEHIDGNQPAPPSPGDTQPAPPGDTQPAPPSATQPAAPAPGDTQPPAFELSEDSEDSMDREAANAIAAAAAARGGGGGVGRQLVHKEHVVKLVTSYQKAILAFTKSKKGVAPSQLIPSKVWQQIYKEYKVEFPTSTFKEDSLKDHLRASLKDLNSQKESPIECEEGEDPSQDEELMTRLMSCDSWKAKNILQTRMEAMESLSGQKSGHQTKSSTPAGSSTSGQTSSVAPPKAASGGGAVPTQIPFKPPTKSQNLKEARQDMAAMLGEFKSMSEDRREDSNRKRRLADGKAALHEAKRQESEERRNTLAQHRVALEEQGKMARINLIKEQKALGLISEEEFKEKCRSVFQL